MQPIKTVKARHGARKKIRVITGRDKAAIEAIARIGVVMKSQLMTHCNLTNDRLNKLCHSGYLKSRSEYVAKLGTVTVYELDKQGERFLQQQGWDHVKHPHYAEIRHDLKLADMYFRCPKHLRDFWYCDKEAAQMLKLKGTAGRENFPDAVIIVPKDIAAEKMNRTCESDYYTIAVEAVGHSYSSNLLAAKLEYASQHFIDYIRE
ncbi:MAG: hypothetical protein HYR87_07350 [Thaumarchaeota archaeon]|nr:hypothetical protein [Nitrososphaerota archaeon]